MFKITTSVLLTVLTALAALAASAAPLNLTSDNLSDFKFISKTTQTSCNGLSDSEQSLTVILKLKTGKSITMQLGNIGTDCGGSWGNADSATIHQDTLSLNRIISGYLSPEGGGTCAKTIGIVDTANNVLEFDSVAAKCP